MSEKGVPGQLDSVFKTEDHRKTVLTQQFDVKVPGTLPAASMPQMSQHDVSLVNQIKEGLYEVGEMGKRVDSEMLPEKSESKQSESSEASGAHAVYKAQKKAEYQRKFNPELAVSHFKIRNAKFR